VLIQNERDENLGLGKVMHDLSDDSLKKDRIVIRNLKNRGEFLGK
jgi:hypothetical protein